MKISTKMQLLVISGLGLFLTPLHATRDWKDILIPVATSLACIHVAEALPIVPFQLINRCSSYTFGADNAPQWVVDYQRKCLQDLGYKNANTVPVKLLRPNNNFGAAALCPWAHVPGIWHDPKSLQYSSKRMTEHRCGHEAVHAVRQHGKAYQRQRQLWQSLGSLIGAGIAVKTINIDGNIHIGIGAALGSLAGMVLHAKSYQSKMLIAKHEKEAEITGAKIAKTAVLKALESHTDYERNPQNSEQANPLEPTDLEQYQYFKQLAKEEGNGHLVLPIIRTFKGKNITINRDIESVDDIKKARQELSTLDRYCSSNIRKNNINAVQCRPVCLLQQ